MPLRRASELMIVAIAAVAAFLAGMLVQYVRAERLAARLDNAELALALARLEGTLGAATLDAQRGSYETARQLASQFFTGLQRSIGRVPADSHAELGRILAQRDATITMLSRSDPESGNVLSRMFARYRSTVRK